MLEVEEIELGDLNLTYFFFFTSFYSTAKLLNFLINVLSARGFEKSKNFKY